MLVPSDVTLVSSTVTSLESKLRKAQEEEEEEEEAV